jgi:pantetheine-phosphate adenylyltransferase
MKIAVFPGSFDPITLGHQDIIERALPLFDRIVVAIGRNSSKKYQFSLEQRSAWIEQTFAGQAKIEVHTYEGLTVDFCKSIDAQFLIRGLRNTNDFEFENAIAQANKQLHPTLETVFLVTTAKFSYISSSIARDVFKNGGAFEKFVPAAVKP